MPLKRFQEAAKEAEDIIEKKEDARKHQPEDDESNWLISYADLMTLLVAFFAMMFSMSKLNAPDYEKIKEEMAVHFGGDYQSPSRELAKFVSQVMQESGIEKDTIVSSDYKGVTLTFQSTLFFNTLSAD